VITRCAECEAVASDSDRVLVGELKIPEEKVEEWDERVEKSIGCHCQKGESK
jgi:hypothetical protein